MGSPKALLRFQGTTFLDHLVRLFLEQCFPVVVVLGHEPEVIRAGLQNSEKAIFVVNEAYRFGQITSMQCGLRVIPEEVDGVLFTLVDHPNLQRSTLTELVHAAVGKAKLAIPRYKGRRGHPLFFSRELVPDFLALPPDSAARIVIERNAAAVQYIDVDDAGILDDVDDPGAYRRLNSAVGP